jgi:multiple antibiotic resistance protein
MATLSLSTTFITFIALLGPQKVLLSFAPVTQREDTQTARQVAIAATLAAVGIGLLCAVTAPWLTEFFHISNPSMDLAGGLIFLIYAIGLVLGLHLGLELDHDPGTKPEPSHSLASGFRVLLLPYVVSPLGVTAVLAESLAGDTLGWRASVAGAYAAVAAINALAMIMLAPVMRRAHATALEVLSRLLGMLLAAVGVELILQGLTALGIVRELTGH